MMMDTVVKVPQETIQEASEEINGFKCLRKEVMFQFMNGEWEPSYSCGRYGNGYGVSFSCKDNCPLRITDLNKCRKIDTRFGGYLVQDDYYDGNE